jgi:hypothetical protein
VPGRLVLALAALCAFLPAGIAPAAAPFYPNQVELDRALEAADAFWTSHDQHNRCHGRNRVALETNFPDDHSDAAGYTDPGHCGTIHILERRAREYTRSQLCTLVVHEYGHTIDYEHVDDPTDIMYYKPVTAGLHPQECDYPPPARWPAAQSWSAR